MAGFGPWAGSDPVGEMAGFAGWAAELLGAVDTSEPPDAMADLAPWTGSDPAGGMAGFGDSAER